MMKVILKHSLIMSEFMMVNTRVDNEMDNTLYLRMLLDFLSVISNKEHLKFISNR